MAMKPRRAVSRRSFIAKVTGGIAFLGSFGSLARGASAQQTDADRHIADQPGAGRGPVSGISDRDPTDSVGNGRGNTMRRGDLPEPERPPANPFRDNQAEGRHAPSGLTDSDPSDPSGDGRGGAVQTPPRSPYRDNQAGGRHAPSGVTDSDPTDPVGDGRGAGAPRARSCSDTDAGPASDPARQGRRC
jgi:hypothetical protein